MDIRLPKLGEGAESGTVVAILVKEGDRVQKGQTLLELENEKAVAPIPAPAAGTIAKLRVKEGDKISVGQVLATLETAGAPVESKKPAGEERETEPVEEDEEVAEEVEAAPEAAPAAAPSIRKIARELGIDLRRVRGTERGGRIVMADVRSYIERLQRTASQGAKAVAAGPAAAPRERIDFAKWGLIAKKPMAPVRQTISRRLWESWNAIPHVTQFDEADATRVSELRNKLAGQYEKKGTRLTLTSFLIKAVVKTLQKHPIFNSSLDETSQELVMKEYFHIGIAVDTEQGLLVPVLRDCDKKSMFDISRELNEVAERARARKVSLEEMQGGTFTISNQGGIGGAHFTPIINRPEVAILGVGRGNQKPVVVNGKVEVRTMIPLALSYDHRVIDGGSAARFITDLVQTLEKFEEPE